jgi:ABC-2 type transport system permease protein
MKLRGILAILFKEFIQMRRDRLTFGIMFGLPIIQLIIFGYSINTNPKHLRLGLLSREESVFSRNLVTGLENSTYYKVTQRFQNEKDAKAALEKGGVSFLITLNSGFERQLLKGEKPQLLLEVDATDPVTIGGALSALPQIIDNSLTLDLGKKISTLSTKNGAIDLVIHKQYNPEGVTAFNIIPGLIGVVLSMTMIMITAMALTRERERGTMENLLSMPISPFEIMVGKISPYIIVGLIQFLVIVLAGKVLFSVPIQGSLIHTGLIVLLFITANLLLGYLFSTIAKTQLQAMQLSFFFFLPSLLLSGFMFPFYGMPKWAQIIGEVFPITHFLRIIRGILLKGIGPESFMNDLVAIVAFIFIVSLIAVARFKRTLD